MVVVVTILPAVVDEDDDDVDHDRVTPGSNAKKDTKPTFLIPFGSNSKLAVKPLPLLPLRPSLGKSSSTFTLSGDGYFSNNSLWAFNVNVENRKAIWYRKISARGFCIEFFMGIWFK